MYDAERVSKRPSSHCRAKKLMDMPGARSRHSNPVGWYAWPSLKSAEMGCCALLQSSILGTPRHAVRLNSIQILARTGATIYARQKPRENPLLPFFFFFFNASSSCIIPDQTIRILRVSSKSPSPFKLFQKYPITSRVWISYFCTLLFAQSMCPHPSSERALLQFKGSSDQK